MKNYLIFTNKYNKYIPEKHNIELKMNKKKKLKK